MRQSKIHEKAERNMAVTETQSLSIGTEKREV